jgi:hypothetical protein
LRTTTIVAIVTSTAISGRLVIPTTTAIPTTRDKSASDVDIDHPLKRVKEL